MAATNGGISGHYAHIVYCSVNQLIAIKSCSRQQESVFVTSLNMRHMESFPVIVPVVDLMLALRSDSVYRTAHINDPCGNAGDSVKVNVKYI